MMLCFYKLIRSSSLTRIKLPVIAGGIIDPTKINGVAQKYIAAGLIATDPSGSLNFQARNTNNNNQRSLKFDFNVTHKDRLVGAGGIGSGNDFADFLLGVPLDYFQSPNAATNVLWVCTR